MIDIAYCGICHTDIHLAHEEWGAAIFPMVPGHGENAECSGDADLEGAE